MEATFDPVCGMQLNPENAPERSEYEGRAYLFCSENCRNKFDENPAQYADRAGAKTSRPDAT
ncbi:MAG TPA: YHS domain-containing protein [Pyrinomonadaceae bacterium]|jgi:YHS domain-containing protein